MKKILILGAGHVTKPLVDYLIDKCRYNVTMAARTVSKAETVIAGRESGKAVSWASDQTDLLDRLVSEHDIVVNLIPKAYHVMVVRACLNHGKDMVTTSYEIPPVRAFDAEAKEKGILILNELGEDPGMDHFGTQMLLDEISDKGGRVISLHSYGSGLPSFKYNNNPMGYKFSWEPKGVFLAAQVPAIHLENGKKVPVAGNQLFEDFRYVDIEGLGSFECYPNKDCTRYVGHFGLDENVTFYRGLLRFSGYCNNMRSFIKLDLLNNDDQFSYKDKTYRQYTASLIGSDDSANVEHKVAEFLKVDDNSDIIHRMRWIGFFENNPVLLENGAKLDVFLEMMLKKMKYAPGETDMTIIHVNIVAEFPDQQRKRFLVTMVEDGEPNGDSAMSRAVGIPPAIATRLIMEGKIKAKGVQMPPALPELYKLFVPELATYGFEFKRQTIEL